jgi:hypothetical protein
MIELCPDYGRFAQNGKIVVKLDRALYGCIELALLWYEAISAFLISNGFIQSNQDECLFILNDGNEIIHLAAYMSDLFISVKQIGSINHIERLLKTSPSTMDSGISPPLLLRCCLFALEGQELQRGWAVCSSALSDGKLFFYFSIK